MGIWSKKNKPVVVVAVVAVVVSKSLQLSPSSVMASDQNCPNIPEKNRHVSTS